MSAKPDKQKRVAEKRSLLSGCLLTALRMSRSNLVEAR